ncbi:M20/M25/M40 family metallo-hydrolase [uncultured Desulfobacter sp.]|uniref:M20 family metallopeptidase n=1 Tax=uncultured Desulfobacter sp. TaxID=240139 RepID=UPI002AAAD4BC|nr:M20/M25/M40 family metallo-hydrolase [uncultured Desulfobacter sp.]
MDETRLKKLLLRMIDIYSPSGKEEDILVFLKNFLKRRGIDVQFQDVDEHRHNLIVAPKGADIAIALIGHVDTVSAYDLEHYMAGEHDGDIIGLGAADMKAGCAAMIEAYLNLLDDFKEPSLPVALCLVVGEEETGDGAVRLMKDFTFPWAVIGEPTNLCPCFESYGYVESQISTQGKRQHASMAGRKKNAVKSLLDSLIRFTSYVESRRPELIYNIRDLSTPPAGFAVPEYGEAWIDIHLPPDAPIGEIISELEDVVVRPEVKKSGIPVLFRTHTIDAGYTLPDKGRVQDCLKEVFAQMDLPWQPGPFPSHSDANHIFSAGTKPVILGPGQLENAHAQDESVPYSQVVQAAVLYHEFIRRLLS